MGALAERLSAAGHTAQAVNLPGHGADTTDASTIGLQDYIDAVVHTVAAVGAAAVLSIDTGHFPMLVRPDELTDLLLAAAT